MNTVVQIPGATRVAVDQKGNLFVSNGAKARVVKFDYADPAALHFAPMMVQAMSSDSRQIVTLTNAGNGPLTLEPPASGQNPTTPGGIKPRRCSTCPMVASSASPAILAPGATCTESVRFTPTGSGAISGSLTITDNARNAATSLYATQSFGLDGTAINPALRSPS